MPYPINVSKWCVKMRRNECKWCAKIGENDICEDQLCANGLGAVEETVADAWHIFDEIGRLGRDRHPFS